MSCTQKNSFCKCTCMLIHSNLTSLLQAWLTLQQLLSALLLSVTGALVSAIRPVTVHDTEGVPKILTLWTQDLVFAQPCSQAFLPTVQFLIACSMRKRRGGGLVHFIMWMTSVSYKYRSLLKNAFCACVLYLKQGAIHFSDIIHVIKCYQAFPLFLHAKACSQAPV